ncbi:MAG: B12-binding domain-containing radical SAM protein [Gemmatimonadota bacterium]
MRVALINTNRIQPPIAPLGLEYVAEALAAAGHEPQLLDLCWEEDWAAAVAGFFAAREVGLVGMSLRNTDDCMYPSRASFLPDFVEMVAAVRRASAAPVIVGGCGFSILPEAVLELCGADAGVWADGEVAMAEVARRLERGDEWQSVAGVVRPAATGTGWVRNPPHLRPLDQLPPMGRDFVDNRRYFARGGQLGFETRRGCPQRCAYCADPVAKGRAVRRRPPGAVADELARLLAQGIDCLHTCDSEFNVPATHAAAVCDELVGRGLGERLRWYAYCAPRPFTRELARRMRRAGCVGINFGTDHGDPRMLEVLGRTYTPEDVRRVTRWCREEGLAVMLDLLLGAPGETEASIRATVELMREVEPDRVGVALGVRLYPGTELMRQLGDGRSGGLVGSADPRDPLFFIEPAVAERAPELIAELVGGDERFFFECPTPTAAARSYNYNANQPLQQALARGYRGAYWDILRRWREEEGR